MENRFELKFRLSEAQFVQAHRTYLRDALLTVKNIFLVTIVLLIGLVQTRLFGGANWAIWIFGGLWIAVVALLVFVYVVMPGRIYRNHPEYADEYRVIADEDGLDWTVGEIRRVILWKNIDRATDVHPDYIYFHPKQGYPYVIPKDAFSSEDELKAFDRFVQKQLVSK